MKQHFVKNLTYLIPTFGIINFFVFYYVATLYYPGGWETNRDVEGFSWVHNYSCTLLIHMVITESLTQVEFLQ